MKINDFKTTVAEASDNKLTPQQKAHERNLDAAQREMDRRHTQGEDMTGAKIDKKTYKIVKPKKQGVAEGSLNEFASSGSDENEYIRGYRDGHGYPEIVKSSKNKEIYMMVTPKKPPLTDRYLQGWNHAKYGPPGRNDLIDLSKLKEQDVTEGIDDVKNIDPDELAGSTLGGIAGYMAGDALGSPMVGFGAAGIGSAVGGALAKEGYTVTRGIDRERYQARDGLEGPFSTKSGKVVYYDKVEGKYYDPDTDMYIDYADWQAMNESDGEYNDEAGMADNNLETLRRAVEGIDDVISDGDNLPEWCQEKIAVAKSMLVTVWDYMKSEDERGDDSDSGSDELARVLKLSGIGLTEDLDADQQFDIIEEMVEQLALENSVDPEQIWEDFESVDDTELYETAAWRRKEGKSKKGGLNAKGVASYRRENPGSKLQTAVTTKPSKLKKGSKAAKRRKSFCARMGGVKGPMKKPNGKPTRKALALRKWNC